MAFEKRKKLHLVVDGFNEKEKNFMWSFMCFVILKIHVVVYGFVYVCLFC